MNSEEVEAAVRKNVSWTQLPNCVKQVSISSFFCESQFSSEFQFFQNVGNSAKEYDKCILHFSLKNQLRYKGSLVQRLRKGEGFFYADLFFIFFWSLMFFFLKMKASITKTCLPLAGKISYFSHTTCLTLSSKDLERHLSTITSTCWTNKWQTRRATTLFPTSPLPIVNFKYTSGPLFFC